MAVSKSHTQKVVVQENDLFQGMVIHASITGK